MSDSMRYHQQMSHIEDQKEEAEDVILSTLHGVAIDSGLLRFDDGRSCMVASAAYRNVDFSCVAERLGIDVVTVEKVTATICEKLDKKWAF